MHSKISGHTVIKNVERLGSGEVEHGGRGLGENGGLSYKMGWGSDIFDDILGRGQNFSTSHHENVSQTSHYSYNFRLFSFQLKDIHKINYSSNSYYFH